MTENAQEVHLLQTDPHALLIKYQPTIRIIVRRYIGSGMFKASEFADVVQSVNVTLLTRMPTLQRQYNNTSLLRTYLSAIIRNICVRLRSEQEDHMTLGDADPEGYDGEKIWERLAVRDASRAFAEAIALYGSQRGRLIVYLKLYYKLPPDVGDLLSAYPACTPTDAGKAADMLGRNISAKTEQEVFSSATALLNKLERKSISAGGHRHWASEKAQEVAELLNVRLPGAHFDKQDLGTLLEMISLHSDTDEDYIQVEDRKKIHRQKPWRWDGLSSQL